VGLRESRRDVPIVNIIFENVVSFLRDAFGSSTGLVSDLKETEPQEGIPSGLNVDSHLFCRSYHVMYASVSKAPSWSKSALA
jgi:hypothetical protein